MMWMTAAQLSRLLKAPLGTIHRWASEDRWRRLEDNRRPAYYRVEDATASATRRKRAKC